VTTRLDLVLQKYPTYEEEIRLLAFRDPSGNLKYLEWAGKVLASGQALASEIADVLDLYHRFQGQFVSHARHRGSHQSKRIHPDIHTYRPQDLAGLRTDLLKMKRARDRKRKKRELLYRIEGSIEADVVYDAPDLVVRHIKNKQASVHYGLSTKWCISMLREGYFNDYEAQNATFFFFERKAKAGDEFDKVALMVSRSDERHEGFTAFDSLDRQVDAMGLAKVYGARVFEIFRLIYEASEAYPGSTTFQVYAGTATGVQLEAVFALLVQGKVGPYDTDSLLESIVCNDGAPWSLLEEVSRRAVALSAAAWKRARRSGRRLRRVRPDHMKEIVRKIESALVIHPATPTDVRETLIAQLRRRRIRIHDIHRSHDLGGVGVSYRSAVRSRHLRMRRRLLKRRETTTALRHFAEMLERRVVRVRKKIKVVERKLAEKAKKRAEKARRS
jgi:hypothetical protein